MRRIIAIIAVLIVVLLVYTQVFVVPIYRDATHDVLTVVVQTYNSTMDDISTIANLVPGHKIILLEKGTATYPVMQNVDVYQLENTGRDLGAFLYYVYTFYDELHGSYIFTSANLKKHSRQRRFEYLVKHPNVEFHCPSCLSIPFMVTHIHTDPAFSITSYEGVNLEPSNIRPYSEWYSANIGPYARTNPLCYNGIFRTNAVRLQSKPRAFYKGLYEQTTIANNTEVTHFIERAAASIF